MSGTIRRRGAVGIWICLATIGAIAIIAIIFVATRGTNSAEEATGKDAKASPAIPDPDVTGMQPAVAALLDQARRSVEANPASADAWAELAEVLDAHALYEHAQRAYTVALELSPDNTRWAYNLALVLWYCADPEDRSIGLLERVAEAEPRYAPVHYRLGQILAREGELEEARTSYERALEVDPDLAIAHLAIGQLLLGLDDTPAAIRHLERAAAVAPLDGPVQAALAVAYTRQGDTPRAATASKKARGLGDALALRDPWRAEVSTLAMTAERCFKRARDLCQAGRYAEALGQLEIAESYLSQNTEVHYYLALAHFGMGNREKASPYIDTVLELLKDDPATAHDAIGALYMTFDMLDEATTHFRQAIRSAPNQASLHYRLAIALARSGRVAEATDAFHRGAQIEPPTIEAHFVVATALLHHRAMPESITHFRQAVALNPANPDLLASLGQALEINGQTAEAIQLYRQAVRINPNHPVRRRLAALAGQG